MLQAIYKIWDNVPKLDTYIKTDAGTVYMAAIIDWYSKAVLSWEISNTMDSSLVMKPRFQIEVQRF